jgi:hypothetical protein
MEPRDQKWKITPWEPSDIMLDQEDEHIVADVSTPELAEHIVELHNALVTFEQEVLGGRAAVDPKPLQTVLADGRPVLAEGRFHD